MTDQVRPLKSLVSWVGGKRRLAPLIRDRIAAVPHDLYAEVFLGMGSVFLARPAKAKVEVINDKSDEVTNLFRVVKHHPAALLEELRLVVVARAEFERLLATPPATLTDIQRAARFFYIQRLNYGGRPGGASLPARTRGVKGIHLDRLSAHLMAIRDRLSAVAIERMDWSELLCRYDRPGALFYLDPPYHGCETYYGRGLLAPADHARLAEALLSLRGRFILSINDTAHIRGLYQGRAAIEEVRAAYTLAGRAGARPVTELLISGGGVI